jgi:hypothetical protein
MRKEAGTPVMYVARPASSKTLVDGERATKSDEISLGEAVDKQNAEHCRQKSVSLQANAMTKHLAFPPVCYDREICFMVDNVDGEAVLAISLLVKAVHIQI